MGNCVGSFHIRQAPFCGSRKVSHDRDEHLRWRFYHPRHRFGKRTVSQTMQFIKTNEEIERSAHVETWFSRREKLLETPGSLARDEVNYQGIYYDDIDWTKDIHSLGPNCPICGADGAEGHLASCYFQWNMMDSPRGRSFLENLIKEALQREGCLDDDGNVVRKPKPKDMLLNAESFKGDHQELARKVRKHQTRGGLIIGEFPEGFGIPYWAFVRMSKITVGGVVTKDRFKE